MSVRCVNWSPSQTHLGRAVIAIGAFDGVHLGHQALLRSAVSEAHSRDVRCVAVTFDRDPDQIITPEAAAPQLLNVDDKCRYIGECGVDTVLIVPFTHELAATEPRHFLDEVLHGVVEVLAVHVGHDFRFGARASGDVAMLRDWGRENGADVRPCELTEMDGAPVTATRIRRLVAAGEVEAAERLLGRPTRVAGLVHQGRRQGRQLGFPTANVVPMPFAALPADGVYAGTCELFDESVHAAAISVGTPPMFPEARDYLEAHLIGFDGDLYGRQVTLSFRKRLRSLRSFDSLDELKAAIAEDVLRSAEG